MKAIQKIFASKYWWLLLVVALFVINYLASVIHARFDLTKEKRYTLSSATKKLIRGLDDKVQIDVFLKGEFPSGFRKLANTTKEFLGLLKDRNPSKIQYQFLDPTEDMGNGKIWADTLQKLGANSINLTVQKKAGENTNYVFPVAIVSYKGKQSMVNLFPGAKRDISQKEINSAEALMEYQFVQAIDKIAQTNKVGIGYAVGNGEPMDSRTYSMRTSLQEKYDFRVVDLASQPKIPDSISLLLIVKPTIQFADDEKLKIDQFVMNGGKLLCFIDNLYAEMDSFALKPELVAYDRNLNLTDLFFKYGLRVNTDLVMDLQCDLNLLEVGGTRENPQKEFLPWNYYPLASTPSGKGSFAVPGYVGLKFANSIDTINVKGVTKTPLLITSDNARTISTPALISLNENRTVPKDELFNKDSIPVAMLLEGRFNSLYKNRITSAQIAYFDSLKTPYKENSEENKIIVVADGDLPFNDFIPKFTQNWEAISDIPPDPLPMGWNKNTYYQYIRETELGKFFVPVSNKDFFLNCVELLVNNPAISETRNKDIVLRLLDSKKVKDQKSTWQFLNIGVPVLLVLLFGWIYQQVRKRKYAS